MAAGGTLIDLPAIEGMEIVDSNGAGDSFFAGLLYGYLKGKNWGKALQYALTCGALAVTDSELAFSGFTPFLFEAKRQFPF